MTLSVFFSSVYIALSLLTMTGGTVYLYPKPSIFQGLLYVAAGIGLQLGLYLFREKIKYPILIQVILGTTYLFIPFLFGSLYMS